eukprot:9270550-Karenia_brevis.AAC.1
MVCWIVLKPSLLVAGFLHTNTKMPLLISRQLGCSFCQGADSLQQLNGSGDSIWHAQVLSVSRSWQAGSS